MGCLASAIILTSADVISIFSLVFLTLDRWLIVIRRTYISYTNAYIFVISTWVVSILVCCYGVFTDSFPDVVGLGTNS